MNGTARTPGSVGSGEAETLSPLALWQTVRKHWPTAVAAALAVIISTVFYTLGQTKIYEADATVLFDPRPPQPLGSRVETVVDLGVGTGWDNQEYYETQYAIIRSMRVSLAVVNDLGLQNDAAFLQNLPPGAKPVVARKVQPELAAQALRGRLEVVPVRQSRLATVKYRDADPQRAQRILSAVVDAYVAQNLDTALDSTTSASDWLRGQLDKLKTDLEASELELHRYKKEKDILSVAFDDQSNMLREEMGNINEELTRVKAQLQEASARSSELDAVPEEDPSRITSSELLRSTLLSSLRQEYERAVRDRATLLGQGKGDNHPDVLGATRQVELAKKAISSEIRNIKAAVRRDVAVLQRQAGGLAGMLDQSRTKAHELNLLEIEYNRLRRSKDNTEKLYSLVLERTKESDLARMMRINNIRVVDRPLLPRSHVYPKVPMNIGMGVFAGLLLGVAAAFLRGMLDRTVKIPDDIEQTLGIPFLGLLPVSASGSSRPAHSARRRHRGVAETASVMSPQLVVHDYPTSAAAEAARAIRTNLMFMAPDEPHRTLLVTSASPGEGKTTVACCIAIAMAQAGQRVVLIDCDLRRPKLHRAFGKSAEVGVSTALIDGDFDEVVLETKVPNLHLVPCGPVPPNPAELFHSEKFKSLLRTMSGRFDRVVIDSAPVAAVTDPAILSTLVDGTVLVARAFSTRKELARHAVRSLQGVGGKIVGAVLNAVDFSRLEYRYSYHYYYYRKDGYYGEEQPERSDGLSRDDREERRPRAAG